MAPQSTPAEAIPAHSYIPGLDGLRAVAVLLVVAFHARLVPGGFVGVDVFFVLSAFLITRILARELAAFGQIRLGHFYKRRLMRLGPALAFFLLAYLLVAPFLWPSQPHLADAILAGLYVSDYSFALFQRPFFLQHTWSLSVEEQFYLIWPLVLPLLLRARSPLFWLALGYVVVLVWRASFGGDWEAYYYRADTRCTGLIVGAALALSLDRLRFTPIHAWAGLGLVLLAALLGRFGPSAATVFPLAEAGAVLLVGAAAKGQLGKLELGLSAPAVVLLGKLSYGIYLWHYPITVALRPYLEGGALFLNVLALSVPLAWLSYVTVERLPQTLRGRVAAQAA